jgi:hypothetical protein
MVDTRSSPTGRRTPPRSAKKTGPKVKVAGRAKGTPNAPKSCPRNWKEAIAKFKSCRKSAFDKIHDLNHQCNLEGKGGQISLALVTLIRPPPPTKGKRKTPDDVVVLAPKSAGLGPPDLLNVALALTNKMGPKELKEMKTRSQGLTVSLVNTAEEAHAHFSAKKGAKTATSSKRVAPPPLHQVAGRVTSPPKTAAVPRRPRTPPDENTVVKQRLFS